MTGQMQTGNPTGPRTSLYTRRRRIPNQRRETEPGGCRKSFRIDMSSFEDENFIPIG
jgi:hypothetical protein